MQNPLPTQGAVREGLWTKTRFFDSQSSDCEPEIGQTKPGAKRQHLKGRNAAGLARSSRQHIPRTLAASLPGEMSLFNQTAKMVL
jgi:hypothetical protein